MSHAYVIQDRNLAGKNDVSLDQFRFGDKVDSPTATSLPVPLAVALLKDRNGLIEVNLPISGSLDDPQLALGDLITHEVVTLIEHAIASPFALLGSRFGGGNDIAFLEFAAGTATLDAAGEAKLKTLARALYERPGLKLDVSGRAHPGADGAELAARAAAAQQVKASEAKGEATPTGVAAKSDEVKITEEELRQLAQSRAQAAKDWLVESGGISAERISIAAPTMGVEGIKDKGGPTRVDFSLR